MPTLSIGIPLYNEAANLTELLSRLNAVLETISTHTAEIILVDDGSSDETAKLCLAAAERDQRIRYLRFSRNFGQQAAYSAVLDHARGDVLVLMDGDLQDAPEALPEFLARHAEGYDVVYAVRTERPEGLLKRFAYDACYRMIGWASEHRIPIQTGDFGLMSRRVFERVRDALDKRAYVRGVRSLVGYRQIGIPVARGARYAGTPKYSFGKLANLAFDGLFAFSSVPIRMAWMLGGVTMGLTLLYTLYAALKKLLFGLTPEGFTGTLATMVFLGGTQLFFVGIVGEYVARIHDEVRQRPRYIVDREASLRVDGA
ncbi:MAG: glycosyltransferase family 2 protein [Gammaproteobacteria bacterium]|nr:glycosyltransferase family 2 protein [Gammaproteobacteria bacterium]